MNRFAALIDRVGYEPGRNAKVRLLADYFRRTPDPERGWALAALTGALSFRHAKPNLIRSLMDERADPVLFRLSRDYVGDLSETVALMWRPPAGSDIHPPRPEALAGGELQDDGPGEAGAGVPPGIGHNNPPPEEGEPAAPSGPGPHVPSLTEVVMGLETAGKAELPRLLATWLDGLDEIGRWAVLKLITSELRIGVSARLAKTALASLGDGIAPDDVEQVWHGLEPPYRDLFAWVEGKGERPTSVNPTPFRPPMLAHPIDEEDFGKLDPAAFGAEWKWDGIRLQAAAARDAEGTLVRRIYSRTGEDVSGAFPDLVEALDFEAVLDGELLILRDGRVQSFNVLQQRLNRKVVTPKMLVEYPAHLRCYDILAEGGEDLRHLPFAERRRGSRRSARGSIRRASTSRPSCPSRPGTSSRQPGRIPPRPAPGSTPTRSRAAC